MLHPPTRRRIALVGTGHRGTGMWGKELLAGWREHVEIVALCDLNPLRAEHAARLIGTNAPVFTDVDAMLAQMKPDCVIVCTRDDTHDAIIIKSLEAGADVVTEKPMTTTAAKCAAILAAEKRTGKHVDVTFNYRFAPTARRIKELLDAGTIGEVTQVDFHWYLDTRHGADYFRRWHAQAGHSGSLFVHKATHHFDLMNWYLGTQPVEVFAKGSLRHYGRNGPFRGERCSNCVHAAECPFYFDYKADPWLKELYDLPGAIDGYARDGCVFAENIDIYDTMAAIVTYATGAILSYSLNACMPVEGHHIAFNGRKGRIELRQYEKQAFDTPPYDEILVMPNFGGVERIRVEHAGGGHFGGDDRLRNLLFKPGESDPLGQRAGTKAGALSMLTGVAALESVRRGRAVTIAELGVVV